MPRNRWKYAPEVEFPIVPECSIRPNWAAVVRHMLTKALLVDATESLTNFTVSKANNEELLR